MWPEPQDNRESRGASGQEPEQLEQEILCWEGGTTRPGDRSARNVGDPARSFPKKELMVENAETLCIRYLHESSIHLQRATRAHERCRQKRPTTVEDRFELGRSEPPNIVRTW